MKSPHGRRGSVCAHFGWTLEYLLHGIPWATVQRMLIDAPYMEETGEVGDPGADTGPVRLTDENAAEIMRMINRCNR